MAQTLIALTALSTPPKLTDNKTLAANMSALTNLGATDLKAIQIEGLAHKLYGAGGDDYRAGTASHNHAQLIQDATSFMGGISIVSGETSENLALAQAALDWGAGYVEDATLSTDVSTLLGISRDFRALPEETLNRIILFLKYRLALLGR